MAVRVLQAGCVAGDAVLHSFDLEWTKNFRRRNASRPFCFSRVSLSLDDPLHSSGIAFSVHAAYAEAETEVSDLIENAEASLATALRSQRAVLTGHQLSSDLSVLVRTSEKPLAATARARDLWHTRREIGGRVVDTRYDIDTRETSRRLVDVCNEFAFDVTQPEFGSRSMTTLQNEFWRTRSEDILERLAILNIRHSLSTALLCIVARRGIRRKRINVNRLIYENLRPHFTYLRSAEFQRLL